MKKKGLLIQENKQIIIAIGASAGGLNALKSFLTHLPQLDCTIIIAQHLANSPKSQLVQILQKITTLTVMEAYHGSTLALNTVYIAPSNMNISVVNKHIVLEIPENPSLPKPSIDILFSSLAIWPNMENVFTIIMSGMGHDGTEGIKHIKAAGGYIIVQEPNTAEFDAMPASAIETGIVNAVLPVEEMGEDIQSIIQHPETRNKLTLTDNEAENNNRIKLFSLLMKMYGTDFSNYKPSTINRRVNKRIKALNLTSIIEYLEYIDAYPNELGLLQSVLLIGVTSFFRDSEAFESLKQELEKLITTKKQDKLIRIWDIGCATGEEAYTIAIILHELLSDNINHFSIKIFATDIDDYALTIARKGVYKKHHLETLSEAIVLKYFLQKDQDNYEVTKSVRNMIYFSRHDITNNPPFIKMDLISCRNLLIYFGTSLQKYIIPLFHYSLNQQGILYLGKSESIGSFIDLFSTVDATNKIYIKNSVSSRNSIKPFLFTTQNIPNNTLPENISKQLSVKELIKETLLNSLEYPYVVINENGDIQESNGNLRLFISLSSGIMNTNLLKLINEDMQLEVRTLFSRVRKENKAYKTKLRKFKLFDKEHFVIVNIKPIIKEINTTKLYLVLFETLDLPPELSNYTFSNEESVKDFKIQEMERELIATKEHLNTYIEELETLNEELQSSNEELQSTNEELQSTNEELHSTGEELQSSNEELNFTNEALNIASEQYKKANEALDKLNNELIRADIQIKAKDKEINRAVLKGEEKKKKEISLELHDNICQMLVGARLLLSTYAKSKQEYLLTDSTNVINDTINEIRNLSHVIYLPKEVDGIFINAIQVLLNQLNNTETIDFIILDDVDDAIMSSDFKVNLYRILQEQIQNIIKYSESNSVVIKIINIDNSLFISVKDDGKGCNLNKNINGIGLTNIKTRVDLFDGKMNIISEEGKGFELKIEFDISNIMPQLNPY